MTTSPGLRYTDDVDTSVVERVPREELPDLTAPSISRVVRPITSAGRYCSPPGHVCRTVDHGEHDLATALP